MKYVMLYKIFEFKKEVGITTKSKETRSQLEPLMQLYHAQSVLATVSSNACTNKANYF